MSLVLWGDTVNHQTISHLSPVLRHHSDLPVLLDSDVSRLPAYEGTRAILCMGTKTLDLFQRSGLLPKNRSLTSQRSRVHQFQGIAAPLMFTYSSGIGEIDYAKFIDVLCDTSSVVRVLKTGRYEPATGDYRWVTDFHDMLTRIDALYAETGRPVECVLDLETVGLDPYAKPGEVEPGHPGAYIVTIQFSCEVGRSDLIHFKSRDECIAWFSNFDNAVMMGELLNSPKISMGGANLKFDLHWLAVWGGLHCGNFRFDSTLVGSLLDENRSNGLDIHAKIYTTMGGYSDEFDRIVDKSRMDKLPPDDRLLGYAGGDTDAGLRVRKVMKEELLKDEALTRFYVNILHPAARSFEAIEQGGVLVDMDAYKELEADLVTEMAKLTVEAKRHLGGHLVAKHWDDSKPGGLNITKASLLNDFMFTPQGLNLKPKMMTEKSGKPSTAEEHLMMFKKDERAAPFIALLSDYSSAAKTLSTYVHGFQKHIRSDGRFHPSYYFFAGNRDEGEGGTVTGRLSCKDPAFQTIPKHTKWAKKLRKCFIAPEGYLILENDYSQGELKVIACVADEPTMIDAYRNGKDLHAITSGNFAGYTYERMMAMKNSDDPDEVALYEATRQLGKAGNFGLIYGMSAQGFHAYAETNYGVSLKMEEAEDFRNQFFNTYQMLPVYHRNYKREASKTGMVRSPLGRIRHLPLINSPNRMVRSGAERQAINSPIQSTLSDMMLWTFALAHKNGWTKTCPAFGAVHDAKYTYIPEDNWEFYAKREIELMENLPFETVNWHPQLKFTADGKAGKNMAELKLKV
jgi:DNA polymerase I-like protein with 3'-5' exonuclease and polymerase domains